MPVLLWLVKFYLISLALFFLSQGISNGSHQSYNGWVQQGLSGIQLQPKKLQLGGWPFHGLYIPIQLFKDLKKSLVMFNMVFGAHKQKFLMPSLIVLAYMCHKVYSNKYWKQPKVQQQPQLSWTITIKRI